MKLHTYSQTSTGLRIITNLKAYLNKLCRGEVILRNINKHLYYLSFLDANVAQIVEVLSSWIKSFCKMITMFADVQATQGASGALAAMALIKLPGNNLGTDSILQDVSRVRDRVQNVRFALKFGWCLDSSIAETPAKFQINWEILTPDRTFRDFAKSYDVLYDIEPIPWFQHR